MYPREPACEATTPRRKKKPIPTRSVQVNVAFFARGLLRQLHTRIYFSDEPANASDPLLSSIEDASVRNTLVARRGDGGTYHFDFVLQGKDETAFLDL